MRYLSVPMPSHVCTQTYTRCVYMKTVRLDLLKGLSEKESLQLSFELQEGGDDSTKK